MTITNYTASGEVLRVPNHPQKHELGERDLPFSNTIYIERDDFMEVPSKGFHRLSPGKDPNSLRYRDCDPDSVYPTR
ncbi:MAG: hypothetical protein AAB288_06160 [Acidobacteriota bacterium]